MTRMSFQPSPVPQPGRISSPGTLPGALQPVWTEGNQMLPPLSQSRVVQTGQLSRPPTGPCGQFVVQTGQLLSPPPTGPGGQFVHPAGVPAVPPVDGEVPAERLAASPFTAGVDEGCFDDNDDHEGEKIRPDIVYPVAGVFLLSMLIFMPLWNASVLIEDTAFFYFVGGVIPKVLTGCCVCILLFYIIAIRIFFSTARPHTHTQQTLMMIGGCFISLLGVLFLLFSSPMSVVGVKAGQEIWTNCQFGLKTRDLFMESRQLQTLRATPECKSLPSVEFCTGYVPTPAALVLKTMEKEYVCNGFCHKQALLAGHAVNATGQLARSMPTKNALPEQPATLFEVVPRQARCDGMAARSVEALSESISIQLFSQGSMLVITSLLVGYLRVFGLCTGSHRSKRLKAQTEMYGAIGDRP